MSQFVFELIDCTNEETYFPIGVFLTLEDAIAAVEACDNPERLLDNEPEDYIKLEIRAKAVGLSGHGKSAWSRKWVKDWTDDDVPKWKVWKPVTPEPSDIAGVTVDPEPSGEETV